jgi:hypothetical protein
MVLGVLNMPLLTESVGMRVRCRHELQSGRWRGPLVWLFLPGGGTAYLLFLAQLLVVILPTALYLVLSSAGSGGAPASLSLFFNNGLGGLLTTLGIVLSCTSLPALFAARASTPLWLRNSLRFFILTLPFWIVILLGIVDLLFQIVGGGFLNSALNPFIAIDSNFREMRMLDAVVFWLALAALGAPPMFMLAARQRIEIRGLRKAAADSSAPAAAAESTKSTPASLEEEPEA